MTDANTWCIDALTEELGGQWLYQEGSNDPKMYTGTFDTTAGTLVARVLKRWNVPHTVSADGQSISVSLSENQVTGVDLVAADICDKFRKSENNHITIASKIADGSLERMLNERDKGIFHR